MALKSVGPYLPPLSLHGQIRSPLERLLCFRIEVDGPNSIVLTFYGCEEESSWRQPLSLRELRDSSASEENGRRCYCSLSNRSLIQARKKRMGRSAPFSPYPLSSLLPLVRAATGSPLCERDNFTRERACRRPRTGPGFRPDRRRS
jgi:hypothetical protein